MALQPRPVICDRAHVWVSLRLDRELSEFEDALLSAHLGRCAHCREYEAGVAAAVTALREAPLEVLDHRVSVPSRRRAILRPTLVAAAVGLITVLSSQTTQRFPASPAPHVSPADVSNRDLVQARALRVVQLGALPRSAQSGQVGVRGAVLQRARL